MIDCIAHKIPGQQWSPLECKHWQWRGSNSSHCRLTDIRALYLCLNIPWEKGTGITGGDHCPLHLQHQIPLDQQNMHFDGLFREQCTGKHIPTCSFCQSFILLPPCLDSHHIGSVGPKHDGAGIFLSIYFYLLFPSLLRGHSHKTILQRAVQNLLIAGAIEKVLVFFKRKGFYSCYFFIRKAKYGLTTIWDLRELNKYLEKKWSSA